MRLLGGAQAHTINRPGWSQPGALRGLYSGEGTFSGANSIADTASIPNGYERPVAWILAPKGGGLSAYNSIQGEGDLTISSLSMGRALSSPLTGAGDLTAALSLIIQLEADLSGLGVLTGSLRGAVQMAAALAASGDLVGAMGAIAFCISNLTASGDVTGTLRGTATMEADIVVSGELLTAQTAAAAVWDALIAGYVDVGSFGELVQAPVYTAKVLIFDDEGAVTDRYVVSWFKNGVPINAGITGATIQVVKVSDGSNLIAPTAMTEIGTIERYKYDATGGSERIVAGEAYVILVSATIDGATRTWDQPIGRDSA